jgi:hypothetical protein
MISQGNESDKAVIARQALQRTLEPRSLTIIIKMGREAIILKVLVAPAADKVAVVQLVVEQNIDFGLRVRHPTVGTIL